MNRPPAIHTALTVLVIVGLTALLLLVPGKPDPSSHGAAVTPPQSGKTTSIFDRPTPALPDGHPDPNVPRTVEDLRVVNEHGSRCTEGQRRIFVLFHGDALASVSHVDELVNRAGSVVVPLLPGVTTRALPLGVLLAGRPGAEDVEVWPCQGEPLRIPAQEIRAAPGRWVMARTPRVFLKLLDLDEHAKRPVLRNIAAVRLLP